MINQLRSAIRAGTGAVQARHASWLNGASLLGTTINTALALRHSLRARGGRGTARFAMLGLGLPTLAEWYAVNASRGLRHHSRPQVLGVPLNAALGWWSIASATQILVDSTLAEYGASDATRRWATPVGAAVVATSLDLALDPFGLALGLWEWRDGGPYAAEIVGPNGRSGIPLGNYLAWLSLIGGVAALYGVSARQQTSQATDPRARREAVQILLPYYLPAVIWALWQLQPKYLLYSALCPLVIACALRQAKPAAK